MRQPCSTGTSARASWKNNSPTVGGILSWRWWRRICDMLFPAAPASRQTTCGACVSFSWPIPALIFWDNLSQKPLPLAPNPLHLLFWDKLSQKCQRPVIPGYRRQRQILDLLKEIPWGQNLLILKKLTDPCRPHLVSPRHRRFRLVAQCPAQSDQGRRLRAGGHREEDPQLSAVVHAGIPRRAGG
jgi:hypothetical protein